MIDENKPQIDAELKAGTDEPSPPKPHVASHDPPLPPASFSMHITMLATQAMVALGQMADPVQGKVVVRKNLARHYIDTLGMLEEKTKGQLTANEASLLQAALHDLRMLFVHAK